MHKLASMLNQVHVFNVLNLINVIITPYINTICTFIFTNIILALSYAPVPCLQHNYILIRLLHKRRDGQTYI